ncbi:MAG: dephospho-CoA kinase [Bacteroidia bacterium]
MLKIGLTGGIGSGKSTVANMFKELGIPIYEADKRAKELQNKEPIKSKVSDLFGPEIYTNNVLNRKALAQIVFNNKEKLELLNRIVHPVVAKDFENWLANQSSEYIVKEAAIIFETNAQSQYDKIILVTAPIEVRIGRVMQRDGIKKKDVEARIKNQLSDKEKMKKADYIIHNTDLAETQKQVNQIHRFILR